ncbi:MAG: hypothetical protein ACHQ6U_10480, partial [Thermodesulfobacteriota bacterium]
VKSERGEAGAWLDAEGLINYERISEDPFGYNGMPGRMSAAEALERSYASRYPDALLQVIQLLEAPRTGDLVLSANQGYDLRAKHESPEHRSSHGALFREHMLVPLAISADIRDQYIRTVDLYPTILSLLGKSVPEGIDGVDVSGETDG